MAKKIFIASTERRSGKSLIIIGLIHALQDIVPRVGYMKPIGQRYLADGRFDEDAALIKSIFNLPESPGDINPVSMAEAHQDKDSLFRKIFDAYGKISAEKDIVVIEGTDYTSAISALEFDINAELAQNLVAPVLLVARGLDKTVEEIVQNVTECADSFKELGCHLLGAVVNRLSLKKFKDNTERIEEILEAKGIPLFGVILDNPTLSGPRLKEIIDSLSARIIYKGDDLSKVVTDTKILAMTPENALEYIKDTDGCLIITPGDRVEHIFTVLSAQRSRYYPDFSGVILTGGLIPGQNVRKLIEGMGDTGLTIASVKDDTFSTALRVNQITGELTPDDTERIDLARQAVRRYVDCNRIYNQLGTITTETITPRMFQYRILQMAMAVRKHIVLPEGIEIRILKAAEEVLHGGICDVTILGNREEIQEKINKNKLALEGIRIIDPSQVEAATLDDYTETFHELRKHKGVTMDMARDFLLDPVMFAAMMVYKGHADGYVSGSTHSTADTLRPVLQLIKTKPGVLLASSIFFMCMPDQVLVYGDCALVESPDAEQLADIAVTSADTAKSFGIDPYVALLSYSTGTSGKGEAVDKIREATKIARKKRPDLPIEGPIQYDAATSQEVALVKIKGSKVAGKATVYIFPDLDAGNTAYKAVQRAANVPAIGPVLQGLNKPANDLSRGATVTDIVYTIAVTAIQAQQAQA